MDDSSKVYPFRYIKSGPFVMVPTIVLDVLMKQLTSNEFRILILIIRKTIGFQKETDRITYSQIQLATGIKSSATVSTALKGLVEMNLIIKTRESRRDIMRYSLNLDVEISR